MKSNKQTKNKTKTLKYYREPFLFNPFTFKGHSKRNQTYSLSWSH